METDLAKDRELGRELARVREAAGLTQAELAERLGVSQTVVSRTESGERQLEDDGIRDFAEAIGTEEARGLEGRRSRDWSKLKRPPLGHPNHDILWSAELKLRELTTLLSQPDITQAFARRIEALCREIESAAAELLKRECNLVFIGKIGVGKTSAICQIADLTVPGSGAGRPSPVLDVGAGRTTLCEVEIQRGPTSIVVEPCTDAEVRAHVADFAEKLLRPIKDGSEKGGSQDDQIMSREVERAIRNMAGLRRPSARPTEGPKIPDPARELARQIFDEEIERGRGEQDAASRLQFEILSRMRTDLRERQDLRWDQSAGVDQQNWLKSEFHRINTGNNPDFTIPKRIRVSVELPLLPLDGDVEVRIVDTKGIDETVARADLEKHVGASHTVLVLCSGFNEAPGTEATSLLRRASEAGIRRDDLQGVALGLPKFDEALQTLDDSGETVGSIEEGYGLKTGVVEETVHHSLGHMNFSVRFFNSHEDDPAEVRQDLSDRIGKVFDAYRDNVSKLVESAGELIANYENAQAQEIVRQATVLIRSWIKKNKNLGPVKREVEQSLLGEVESAHPASIHATMRRNGGWYNLDYGHHLAYGARLVVSSVLRSRVRSFAEICDTFLGADQYRPAEPLLSQAQRTLEKASQTATERAQLLGETWFHDTLEEEDEFWTTGIRRWGGGGGYVDDISTMNKSWFSDNGELNEKMEPMIKREWKRAMKVVEGMLEDD